MIHPQFQNHVFIITVSHTLGQTKHLPMELSIWTIIHKQALVIALKSFKVQPKKNDLAKIKKNIHIRPKSGPTKAIFGQKSGPAMAGPALPPTTALFLNALSLITFQFSHHVLTYFKII